MKKILSVTRNDFVKSLINEISKLLDPLDQFLSLETKIKFFTHSLHSLLSNVPAMSKQEIIREFDPWIRHSDFTNEKTIWEGNPKDELGHNHYYRIILNTGIDDRYQLVLFIRHEKMQNDSKLGEASVIHDHATLCGAKPLNDRSRESVYKIISDKLVMMIQHHSGNPRKKPLLDNLSKDHPFIHNLIFPRVRFSARLHVYLTSPDQCANRNMDYKHISSVDDSVLDYRNFKGH